MMARLRKETMYTAVGCFIACGFMQLTGALLAAVNYGVIV